MEKGEERTYSREKGNMYKENDGGTDFSAIIKEKEINSGGLKHDGCWAWLKKMLWLTIGSPILAMVALKGLENP